MFHDEITESHLKFYFEYLWSLIDIPQPVFAIETSAKTYRDQAKGGEINSFPVDHGSDDESKKACSEGELHPKVLPRKHVAVVGGNIFLFY